MEKLILIPLILVTYVPIMMMFITSFNPEWKKVEEEYSLLRRKWLVIFRCISMVGMLVLMCWLARMVREGCKECPEYEQITTPIFKKK